ncbi:MAG: hypothetical protein Q7I95_02555, partial [Thiobacillus sp.]|nr:hypothetical protein [Thiobacillus sp.]
LLSEIEPTDPLDAEHQRQLLESCGADLYSLRRLSQKYNVPFDLKDVQKTLEGLLRNGINGDERLVALTVARDKELDGAGDNKA